MGLFKGDEGRSECARGVGGGAIRTSRAADVPMMRLRTCWEGPVRFRPLPRGPRAGGRYNYFRLRPQTDEGARPR